MRMHRWSAASIALLAIASACYDASERPQTGGHTNWLQCRTLDDCAQSPEAVECAEGYCLDAEGDRIEAIDGGEPAPNDAGGGDTDAGGGDTDAADAGDPCRRCPLNVDGCVEQSLESFPDLEVTLEEWSATMCVGDPSDMFPYLLEAMCDDRTRVLIYGSGLVIERRHYDASGQFLARETGSDAIDAVCGGVTYWPVRVVCENAVATNVVCGTATIMVGDPVPF
jgi:hypothetical protein